MRGTPQTRNVAWFQDKGWKPFPFQREVWRAFAAGQSGMLHATTGAGKTFAVWLGALAYCAKRASQRKPAARKRAASAAAVEPKRKKTKTVAPPLTVLWITPMRALAADTAAALNEPLPSLAPDWTLGIRTGDTASAQRAAQDRRLPTALVTTPESLSLMLTRADAEDRLKHVEVVIVDEWHELMGNKRGTQVQLALARLRQWAPDLIVWGLSATLGNQAQAMHVLLGDAAARNAVMVRGKTPKRMIIDTLLPALEGRFPWAGHLGMSMLPQVVDEIDKNLNTLIFVNTRSQAELWYQALLEAKPEWAGWLALHHGSLDQTTRLWVESELKAGRLKAVVCTSSLDLGVDFHPVERVLQIGSPKGIARLLQRAGRSGHAPGRPSRVTLVPTHMLELIEAAAARAAAQAGEIETRRCPEKPLDVLVQHLVTVALGGGFKEDHLFAEVRNTYAYRDLTADEWQWSLDFVQRGGRSLTAYPDYRRALPDDAGVWRVPDATIARRHRMSIGTIVSDANMTVRYWSGRGGGARLGSVEESFIARLKRGDHFLFAGRLLELVRIHEMTAYVRRATGKKAAVPRWNGGRMPLSSELAFAMVRTLDDAREGRYDSPELIRLKPLLDVQAGWSALPGSHNVLAEQLTSREGTHLFLYPFAGRQAHLGMASLIAWRIARNQPVSFSMAVNDYGFELLTTTPIEWADHLMPSLFDAHHLHEDIMASLNAGELSQRRFREIARVSGLVFPGYPGANKGARQLQASSGLFYEVLRNHDPENMLLTQAEREVLEQELELGRLRDALHLLNTTPIDFHLIPRPTPFSFPLLVERFREKLSTEKLADRVARMVAELNRIADQPPAKPNKRARPAATT